MLFTKPVHMSAELNELVQFVQSTSLTDEQSRQIEEIVNRLDERIKFQRRAFEFLKQSFSELNHLIKCLVFDLNSTRIERNRLEAVIKRMNRTDRSN